MTNQEAFDTVLTKLREQKVRSVSASHNMCLYRGPNGTKCAAGHLIPDALYSENMEGNAIADVIGDFPGVAAHLGEVDAVLLARLQEAHDLRLEHSATEWEYSMQLIAKRFNLKYTPPI